jgi:hypothetical protein
LNSTWDFKFFFNNNASFNSKFKMNLFHFFISFFFAIILFSNYLLYALSCLEIVENINNIITFVYRFKIIVPYWSPIFAIICLLFLFQTWIGHSKYLDMPYTIMKSFHNPPLVVDIDIFCIYICSLFYCPWCKSCKYS